MSSPTLAGCALAALAALTTGCPDSGARKTGQQPPGAPSAADMNSAARDAARGAKESLKTAPERALDGASRAAQGAKTALEESPERAERAAEGAKTTAGKATKKGSKLLDKVFDRD